MATTITGLKNANLFREQAFINGQWVGADKTIDVNNPATGDVIGAVPNLGAQETKAAIEAAEKALPDWRGMSAQERGKLLRRWGELIVENLDDLCRILTTEQGKPLSQAKSEILSGVDYLDWMAEEGRRAYGDIIPSSSSSMRFVVLKQPVGVTAAITPWNFPSSMITRKVSAALAAGCTSVIKPSELTPFSALALMELSLQAGIPAGVLNVVTGDAQPIGQEICENPVVRKLGFTGSTAVGKKLMAQCAGQVKKVSLELGGNAPFIVFDDADIDAAVEGAILCKFRNSGQTCICANRIFVQEGIYDTFVEKFKIAVNNMKTANGLEEDTDLGPLINMQGVEKVERHLADAVEKGATVETGGKRHALGHSFFEPTVLSGAKKDMVCFSEETFGPLAPVYRFKSEEGVIAEANDTEYGLAAYFYTKDLGRAWRVGEALEYGMVGINGLSLASAQTPFGGIKESGIGREGSKYGLDEYLEIKLLQMGGL